jgi:hypothetical protein
MTRRIRGRSEFGLFFGLPRGVFADFFLGVVAGGEVAVFAGVFDKLGGWCGVFCGQSVVNCVVKMVN